MSKAEIAQCILTQTEQDIIQWEYDHNFGYIAVANTVEFRIVCNRESNQVGINGIWITVSQGELNAICNEIAKQSERIRTKKIYKQIKLAGFCNAKAG